MTAAPRVAVIGHVEWVTHAIGALARPGEIAVLADPLEEPAGGGGVSAAQAAKLGADCRLYTALAADEAGAESARLLPAEGITVLAAPREGRQRRALSVVGAGYDRTILVVGPPLFPSIDDPLPWDDLARTDAVYFTGDDPRTLIAARAARHLVVTARRLGALAASGVRADVLVASANDPGEAFDEDALPVRPGAVVRTEGGLGGRVEVEGGPAFRWEAVAPPGPAVDSYGCGDSFAAGLTVGLARGWSLAEAIGLGARCGAACLTGRGGLGPQLREP
jgi:ribokinase